MKFTGFPPIKWVARLLPLAVLLVFGSAMAFGWPLLPGRQSAGQELSDGITALRANDYATARHVFEALAQKNDRAGEVWLAHLYQEGLGVTPDAQRAVALLTKAAEAGSPEAAKRLGKLYLDGDGVLQDVGAARTWLSRAAEDGDAGAQRELGLLYLRGLGMAKNPRKAYVWLDIAARNGDEQAQLWRDRALAMLTPDEAAHAAAEAANTQQQLTAEARGGHEADVKDAADTASPATAPASAARGWKDIIALRFQQEIAGLGPHER